MPAKASSAVAKTGVRMVTSDCEKERRPLVFWYSSRGTSSVAATSLAGCCTVFIRPLSAFRIYMCQGKSRSAFNSPSTISVQTAAHRSQQSMVRFLSQRSLSAPAKTLIST